MSKKLFLRIVSDLEQECIYFTQSSDARGKRGFSPLKKCTSAICQLAYGVVPDTQDEYLKMSERTFTGMPITLLLWNCSVIHTRIFA